MSNTQDTPRPRGARSRRRVVWLTVTALVATIGIAIWARPTRPLKGLQAAPVPGVETSPAEGVGETLILVVEGFYPEQAVANAALAAYHFGDVQGMYVAPTSSFALEGAYELAGPELVSAACNPARIQCDPSARPEVTLSAEPPLQYAAMEGIPALRTRQAEQAAGIRICGTVDAQACVSPLMSRLVASDALFGFPSGAMTVSAFRTKAGAQEFLTIARAAGLARPLVVRATKLASGDVGLGQEPHPNGSGPLLAPLPNPESYQ